jgi:hypothetical protein
MGKKKQPEFKQDLNADGCLSFLPLQERMERLGHQLSGIAIVDEPCEKPAYQQLVTYDHKLRAGQHVYLRADPTGERGNEAIRAFGERIGAELPTMLVALAKLAPDNLH